MLLSDEEVSTPLCECYEFADKQNLSNSLIAANLSARAPKGN